MGSPSILDGLMRSGPVSKGRRAFLFPVLPGFRPGQPIYEQTIDPIRRASHVDILGLTVPFGPMSEDALATFGPLLDLYGSSDTSRFDLEQTGAIRTRAWLDTTGPLYERLVLLSHLPAKTLRHWTRAVPFHPIADRIRIITLPVNGRPSDPYYTDLFAKALALSEIGYDGGGGE